MVKAKRKTVIKKFWDVKLSFIIILAAAMILFAGISQVLHLQKAHSTFEDYYAFRGCTKILQRTSDFGICKTGSGETIKIVKFDGRWFLDGDLPCGFLCF